MPNGHQLDLRPLWERVRDMQEELSKEREKNADLRKRIQDLSADRGALLSTIEMLRKKDD